MGTHSVEASRDHQPTIAHVPTGNVHELHSPEEGFEKVPHAGTNLSLIRKVALSLLRQDPGKGSLNWKRLNAALDESYMLQALRGFPKI